MLPKIEINTQIVERLGYYEVASQRFNNKLDALMAATKLNQTPHWRFNDRVYSKVNWEIEPSESLMELYKKRALQLREKYDYLVLNYSAGSDSQNILDTFLMNNIKLDEICVRWSLKGYAKYSPSRASRPDNMNSEWYYALVPGLEKIRQLHPEIHIEIIDSTEESYNMFDDNDPWYQTTTGVIPSPGHINRWVIGLDRYQKMFVDKGVRCCQIFGVDKPRLVYDNNTFYTFFLDVIAGAARNFVRYNEEYNPFELFYWTPDMPQIVQKQAHVVMNFFKANPGLMPVISRENATSWVFRNTYETICRSLVYPTWDPTIFQAPKPMSVFKCETDDWFFKNIETGQAEKKPFEIWQDSLKHIEKNIGESWLTFDQYDNLDGIVGMISPLYKIGGMEVNS